MGWGGRRTEGYLLGKWGSSPWDSGLKSTLGGHTRCPKGPLHWVPLPATITWVQCASPAPGAPVAKQVPLGAWDPGQGTVLASPQTPRPPS